MNRPDTIRPIWSAYADADLARSCPNCQAAPEVWCTNRITGRVRRTPCLARIRATTSMAMEGQPQS